VVVDRMVEAGEYVAPGTVAFEVADIDRVKVVVDVPERDVFVVRPGLQVSFEVDALKGRAFTGTVSYVAAAAHPMSNTFRTEVVADNAGQILKPGLIVRVLLTRRTIPQAMTIPIEALVPNKGQYVAYVADKGTAIRRVVQVGPIIGRRAVVETGLRPGENVIVEGQRLVSDGAAVQEGPAQPQ
jgi:membrane fusion protein, multidrug efflux system